MTCGVGNAEVEIMWKWRVSISMKTHNPNGQHSLPRYDRCLHRYDHSAPLPFSLWSGRFVASIARYDCPAMRILLLSFRMLLKTICLLWLLHRMIADLRCGVSFAGESSLMGALPGVLWQARQLFVKSLLLSCTYDGQVPIPNFWPEWKIWHGWEFFDDGRAFFFIPSVKHSGTIT